MTRRPFRFHLSLPGRTLLAAIVLAILPPSIVAAQELPRVRVTQGTTVHAMRHNKSDFWMLMRVDSGAVLEYIAVDGDQGRFLESNHYLVVLPRNEWGTAWTGWISGRNLEPAPRPPAAPRPIAAATSAVPPRPVAPVPEPVAAVPAPEPPVPVMTSAAPRLMPEIIVRFAFDRSDLAETAKNTLETSLTTMRGEEASLTFALGGHADATGPDDYNDKLGLARAEAVRKYMVEELNVPAGQIRISSYGESRPVASNDTRDGRAQNRRVVVTVTAGSAQ